MEWTKENVIQKMEELRDKGFIRVPADMFRKLIVLRPTLAPWFCLSSFFI